MARSLSAVMAAFAAIAAVAAVASAPAAAADPTDASAVPPAMAVTPGAGVGVYNAAGQLFQGGCTLGFLATGADGAEYAFTAGHCASDGKVVMRYQTADNYKAIGRFADSVYTKGGQDIAIIRLDVDGVPLDTRVLNRRPVTGVTAQVKSGEELCFFGQATGDKTCGKVGLGPEELGEPRVIFSALSQHGDSGGPVYRIEKDGTATAVAILDQGANGSDSAATLIQPYLEKWGLTISTTPRPGSPAQPVGYQPGQ